MREAACASRSRAAGQAGCTSPRWPGSCDPAAEITVWERNAPDDTFGFGVVFSDETLGGIENADPVIYRQMEREFARWDDIDVHYRGQVITSGGHGFAAMSRRRLLEILQQRCAELGVTVLFRAQAPDPVALAASYDLVVAADGANSAIRAAFGRPRSGPTLTCATASTCGWAPTWSSTRSSSTSSRRRTASCSSTGTPTTRPAARSSSRCTTASGRRPASASWPPPPRPAPGAVGRRPRSSGSRELFAGVLGGHAVHANNSRWLSFATLRCGSWRDGNVVLLGDAAHTAHFSIGSGTKLAMEDALALAACLHEQPAPALATHRRLAAYEAERRPVVASTQRAAQASLEWFENLGQYTDQEPEQFAFNIMTRSRRVTHDNLRLRDPEFTDADGHLVRRPVKRRGYGHGRGCAADVPAVPAARRWNWRTGSWCPRWTCTRRADGMPSDFHLVHLGGKALGGAGLVMTEMVCVSAEGRITPGCAGMYAPEHEAAWQRITAFVHGSSGAKIGLQLGHSGRKGATRLMWEGMDEPLPDGNVGGLRRRRRCRTRPGSARCRGS